MYSFIESIITVFRFSILGAFVFFLNHLLVLYHNLGDYILCGGNYEIQRLLTVPTLIFTGMLILTISEIHSLHFLIDNQQ